jgi:hypothetical protein
MGGTRLTRTLAFERALLRLEEALEKPEDAIVRDACVQRFEFTFVADAVDGAARR